MARRITITLGDDQKVSVEGDIGDQLLAYGLLQIGADCLRAHYAQSTSIRPPSAEESSKLLALHQ
jgi:hypothetical protein